MPSALLDVDSKYEKLLETYKAIYAQKFNETKPPNCRVFENVLEALNSLTEARDDLLKNQLLSGISLYSQTQIQKNMPNKSVTISNKNTKINVLITGSLYLVGLSLKVLNFNID